MWKKANANPAGKLVDDCVVRAISIATNQSWLKVYDDIYLTGRAEFDMPNSNDVWGLYLYRLGFEPFVLPSRCPRCVTIETFCRIFPIGTYIIGTGSHAVAIIDGDYYDTWDSGNQIASYFWRVI